MGTLEPHESFVERIIRRAIEQGGFDGLPGAGKPTPGAGTPDGEGWWIRRWVQRNRAEDDGRSDPPPTTPPSP
ncbi:MAG TPA: DnaJ family domain-containing protein [Acidimicrobiia bacterium]|nr:DnaJ family domain-containing protein [Acidimicrobiia bacterium]